MPEQFATLRRELPSSAGEIHRANGVQESAYSAFLDELLTIRRPSNRPDTARRRPAPSEMLLDVEASAKRLSQSEAPSIEQVSVHYSGMAEQALQRALRRSALTTDSAAPRTFEYNHSFHIDQATTARELARQQLGNATADQLAKYTALIVSLNNLTNDNATIAAGQRIKLPGQRADGGLTYRHRGSTFIEWHNGNKLEQTERGQGTATFRDPENNCQTTITWDPEQRENNKIIRATEDRRIETLDGGVRIERVPPKWGIKQKTYRDSRERSVSMEYDPDTDKLLKVTIRDWANKTLTELAPDTNGRLRGVRRNADGDLLSVVGAVQSNDRFLLYDEKVEGDTLQRSYENGIVEEFKAGRLAARRGKDDWGRLVEELYTPPGRVPPHKIYITLNDNSDPEKRTKLEFTRTDFGEYWGESRTNGTRIRFELRPTGQIIFRQDQRIWSDLKDGTHLERTQIFDSADPQKVIGYRLSATRDHTTFTAYANREGSVQRDSYSYGGLDGRTIERTRTADGEAFTALTIRESTGFRTELTYDTTTSTFTGKRYDSSGRIVEHVAIMDDMLIYTNERGGSRVEQFRILRDNLLGERPRTGLFDAQVGTHSFENDDETTTVRSVAPGRTDSVMDECSQGRSIIGTTIRGERSLVTPTTTVVHNPDGTGVRLNEDSTVDRWGASDRDNAIREPLTEAETDYLRHAREHGYSIDLRDFVEIHRQMMLRQDGESQLQKFYNAMKQLDTARNLTADELRALRLDLMHDIAHPEEFNQSRAPTCNTQVIRRELAIYTPDLYVMHFYHAISDGRIPIYNRPIDGAYGSNTAEPDGFIEVDPRNLKLVDSTGRNLASRIFDNLCISINAHPDYTWVATEDGVGKFVPKDSSREPKEFTGLQMGDIAEILTKLSGVRRGVVQMESEDDLQVIHDSNGGRCTIAAVNASRRPFSWVPIDWDNDNLYTNHVVNVTNVFKRGDHLYVNFMNNWGLTHDHSTPRTALRAAVFLNNMTGINNSWRGARPMTPPQFITRGDPTKVYHVVDGKIVEDERYRIMDGRVQER